MIIVIRTTSGRENAVIDSLISRVKSRKLPIKALVQTEELRGYIFVEADEINDIQDAIRGVPHIRGIMGNDIAISEIERFLIPEKQVVRIEADDIIEIISGPFKGEKAKVTKVDEIKNEVTVELLEAAIPIPVTIPIATTRLHEKSKADE